MDVKEAVRRAKAYVVDLFAEEGLEVVGLEEVEHDDILHEWRITFSMSRRDSLASALARLTPSFKVVVIRDTGEIRSVKHRSFAGG